MNRLLLTLFVCCCPGLLLAGDAVESFQREIVPILHKHCVTCHDADEPAGKLNLADKTTLDQLKSQSDRWYKVLAQVESRAMPPDGEPELPAAARQAIRTWIDRDFTPLQIEQQRLLGRAKLRRMTRTEYANTFHDLLGIRPAVMQFLPEDGRIKGYEKNSAALPFSTASAEGYLKIADHYLDTLLKFPPNSKQQAGQTLVTAKAFQSEQSAGHILELDDGWKVSFNTDKTSGPNRGFNTVRSGIHKLRMHVYGYQTDKPLPFGVYVGSTGSYPQILELAQVLEAPPGKPAIVETELWLDQQNFNDLTLGGDNIRLIPFGLGVQVPKNHQASQCRGPGLAFHHIDIEQPAWPTPGEQWLLADFPSELVAEMRSNYKPIANATGNKKMQSKIVNQAQFLQLMEKTLTRIMPRFYRRPVAAAEIAPLLEVLRARLEEGVTLDKVFLQQLQEILTAPDFLCLAEQPGKLNDTALASRLSYFLWTSTPDEKLLQLASQKQLQQPKVLREQVERMLADPKSERFVADFTNQWLGLNKLDETSPDEELYPEYSKNDQLKSASVAETRRFFRELLDKDLSVTELIDSDWTFANESLAQHYGLAGITGTELRKVNFPPESPYGGIWTQSSIMKTTANGTTTTPIKRGVWVSERLLGIDIPPPPPNINPVEPDVRGAKSLRELLALHRQGSCNACHAKFDPYGFALESFDVIGQHRRNYRELDRNATKLTGTDRKNTLLWKAGLPVDCSGETPQGKKFADLAELRQVMLQDPSQIAFGLTCHLTTYATSAPATDVDRRAIDEIVASAKKANYGVRSLIQALIQSELFQSK